MSHMTTTTLLKVFASSEVRCSRLLLLSCPAWLITEAGSKALGFHPPARSDAPQSPVAPAQPVLSTFVHHIHGCLPAKAPAAARQPLTEEG